MLGFAPIGSGPIASNNSAVIAAITTTIEWTESSETVAAAGTVSAPAGVSAVIGWTENAETLVLVGAVISPVSAVAAWTEGGEIHDLAMHAITVYARAPAGAGYAPRAEQQCRPPDVQRNYR